MADEDKSGKAKQDDPHAQPAPRSDQATGPGPSVDPYKPPTAEGAEHTKEREAVDREMAHQERIDQTGSQHFGDPDAGPPQPETPSPGMRFPANIESIEPIVDTTHWPEAFRNLMAQCAHVGERMSHEGTEYEILMGTGGDYVLVTDVGDAEKKSLYVMRRPHAGETPAGA